MEELDNAIKRIAGEFEDDGSTDNLLTITKNVASDYYYVPSVDELKSLKEFKGLIPLENVKIENILEPQIKEKQKEPEVLIYIEYCTNCGYNTIYQEKKRVLEAVSNSVKVIGNARMPRQSAFEIKTQDGVTLWSKLEQPDGRNNSPDVFPTNHHLIKALQDYLKLPNTPVDIPRLKFYEDDNTRVGIW